MKSLPALVVSDDQMLTIRCKRGGQHTACAWGGGLRLGAGATASVSEVTVFKPEAALRYLGCFIKEHAVGCGDAIAVESFAECEHRTAKSQHRQGKTPIFGLEGAVESGTCQAKLQTVSRYIFKDCPRHSSKNGCVHETDFAGHRQCEWIPNAAATTGASTNSSNNIATCLPRWTMPSAINRVADSACQVVEDAGRPDVTEPHWMGGKGVLAIYALTAPSIYAEGAGPSKPLLLLAARTLNAAGQSRVTLSLA